MFKIDKFLKWFLTSFVLGLIGLTAAFFVQDIASINGELNQSILLVCTITIFILILISLFSIIKANFRRMRSELIMSAFVVIIPLTALLINSG